MLSDENSFISPVGISVSIPWKLFSLWCAVWGRCGSSVDFFARPPSWLRFLVKGDMMRSSGCMWGPSASWTTIFGRLGVCVRPRAGGAVSESISCGAVVPVEGSKPESRFRSPSRKRVCSAKALPRACGAVLGRMLLLRSAIELGVPAKGRGCGDSVAEGEVESN